MKLPIDIIKYRMERAKETLDDAETLSYYTHSNPGKETDV